MSFGFSAAGSKYEVLDSLRKLNHAQLPDGMGDELRNILVDYLEDGADPASSQRYVINVSGHSGGNSLVTLNATVSVEDVAAQPADNPPASA
jgi:hypothetical protein